MVGQRYVSMLASHPFFKVTAVTGKESVGKKYCEAATPVNSDGVPTEIGELEVQPTSPRGIDADLAFSPLPTEAAHEAEPAFAKAGFPVISDASAHRMQPDVPLVIPEVNPEHLALIRVQRKKRKWPGFIATTPNCTAVGLALALKPLHDAYTLEKVVVTTMQSVSGAGLPGVPSMHILENVIPYIPGEEEKVANETRKILGTLDGASVKDAEFNLAASCNRVPTLEGHLEAVYIETRARIEATRAANVLQAFKGKPQQLKLPTAPRHPIIVMSDEDRPQPRLDRYSGTIPGMSVVVGRIRAGINEKSLRFTILSHNTIRGAAGSTILLGELMHHEKMLGG